MSRHTDEFVTKVLVPRRRPDIIRRQRLLDILYGNLDHRLTVVHAPAGYGKTTLLIDFVHDLPMPVCWLSLDEEDRDQETFLRYLLLSLRHHLQRLDPRIELPASPDGQPGSADAGRIVGQVVTTLHRDIGEPVTLILDDFHSVDGCEAVTQLVNLLLLRLPPNCHMIICGRTKPSLSALPRLQAQRELATIDASLLAFTVEEIRRYYSQVHGVELNDDGAKKLAGVTEGWVAALALMPARDSMPTGLGAASAEETFEYLAAEVFDGLDRELQEFLLAVSVLSEVDVELCNTLLTRNDSQHILHQIEARNLFLTPIDPKGMRSRFHPLFQEFLVSRFRREQPDRFEATSATAGELLTARGRWGEAIRHLAAAGRWDQAASVVEQAAPEAFAEGRWQTIAGWLETFPSAELPNYPKLILWRARILYQLAQPDKALEVAAAAIPSLEGRGDNISLADAYTVRGMALRLKGEHGEAAESCRHAVALLMSADGPIKSVAEARKQLGIVCLVQGLLLPAHDEFKAVLDIHEASGDVAGAAFAHECLGLALGKLGQLSGAGVHLEKARRAWQRLGNHKELATVLNNLGMLYYVQGEAEKALALFHDAVDKARRSGHARAEAYALASIADIDRDRGAYDIAVERYNVALDLGGDLGDTTLCTQVLTSLSDTYRLRGDFDKADILVRQAAADAEERESWHELGIAKIGLGLLLRERGDSQQAVANFSHAAELLSGCHAKREEALAQYHLGETLFLSRRGRSKAMRALERAAQLCQDLGYDHFLLERALAGPEVAQYAASKRIAASFYRRLLEKMASSHRPRQEKPRRGRPKPTRLPPVEVFALRPMEVLVAGRRVLDFEWQSEKSKEMFLFLLRRGDPVRKEEILAALWPDLPLEKCNSSFHSTLYRLRRALYTECVVEQTGRYVLNPLGRFWCDAAEFEDLIRKAEQARQQSARWASSLRRALDLYRGPFGNDFYSDWLEADRRRLEDMYLRCLVRLAQYERQRNTYLEAVSLYEKAVDLDPLNESLWYQLIETYTDAGQLETATRCYRRYVETVRDQLGEEPATAVTDLYNHLCASLAASHHSPQRRHS
jgi:ATP/maltotriose-dependent transcriptional regulator MalT/DNA-binding SARP family transcriptional activator